MAKGKAPRSSSTPQVDSDEDVADYIDAESKPDYSSSHVALQREPRQTEVELVRRTGADMPETLEVATWLVRGQLARLWDESSHGQKPLNLKQAIRLERAIDGVTKLDRSVRQWRKLEAEELGALREEELDAVIPLALEALGIPIRILPRALRAIGHPVPDALLRALGAMEDEDE